MARLIGALGLGLLAIIALGGEPTSKPERPRVPVGLVWNTEGLFVATRDGRSLIKLDPIGGTILKESAVGVRAASLREHQGRFLVGSDDGELAVVTQDGDVTKRLNVGRGPVRVASLTDGQIAVSVQWSDAIKVVDLATGTIEETYSLPFSPGALVESPDGKIFVADAFKDAMALIDRPTKTVKRRSIDGVSPRAMALSADGKELLITHVNQYGEVAISKSNLDWGLVLSTKLSAIKLTDLEADPTPEAPTVARRRLNLDGSGNGAADPAALAISPNGTKVLIALAGANQLMVNDRTLGAKPSFKAELLPLGESQLLQTVEVGRSPVALAIDPTGNYVATANSMDDTITIVKLDDLSVVRTIALNASPVERDAVARGEALFRDGRRGFDRWMSCESCHSGGGHTIGLNFDTQGDGNSGVAKNTPSLFGVGSTAPYTWTGQFPDLADQIHQSFQSSLRGPAPDRSGSEDVAGYLRSLSMPPPKRTQIALEVMRGATLFGTLKCAGCHAPPTYTRAGIEDVGLNDGASGHTEFNPPSLRGVGRTAPYLHDGRSATLDDVLKIHPPEPAKVLTNENRADLAAFLESL